MINLSDFAAIANRRTAVKEWLKEHRLLTVMYWGSELPRPWWQLIEEYIAGEPDEDLEIHDHYCYVDSECSFYRFYLDGVCEESRGETKAFDPAPDWNESLLKAGNRNG